VTGDTQMQTELRRTREEALARVTDQVALLQHPPGWGRTVYRTPSHARVLGGDSDEDRG